MGLFNIGFDIGFHNRRKETLPPFKDDLTFDFWKRDIGTLTLIDRVSKGVDNVVVAGGVGCSFNGTNNLDLREALIPNDFTILLDIESLGGVNNYPISQYTAGEIGRFIVFYKTGGFDLGVRLGSDFITYNGLQDSDVDKVLIKRISGILTIQLEDTILVSGSAPEPIHTGANTILGGITVGFVGNLSGVKIFEGEKSYEDALKDEPAHYHGLNGNYRDSETGIEAINNGTVFSNITKYTPNNTLLALDNGYYQNDLSPDEQVTNAKYPLPIGWTAFLGGKLHNLITSYIDFTTPLGVIIDGQSNSTGRAEISSLPSYLTGVLDGCYIFQNGIWKELEAGVTNNGESDCFSTQHGIELELAYRLRESTKRPIYILKMGHGGSNLVQDISVDHSINSIGELHQDLLDQFAAIKDKETIEWASYIWIQGENDCLDGRTTLEYQTEWELKLSAVKNITGIASIYDYKLPSWLAYSTVNINQAKDNAAALYSFINTINSDGYTHKVDNLHLDSAGAVALGLDLSVLISAETGADKYETFNRSNATIYNDTARTDDYDPTKPNQFRIDKTFYDAWQAMLNPAYQNTIFAGLKTNYGTKLNMFELFTYANQKTGDDLIDVLKYINYIYEINGLHFYYSDNSQYLPLI